jgi:hypothetical protein
LQQGQHEFRLHASELLFFFGGVSVRLLLALLLFQLNKQKMLVLFFFNKYFSLHS